MMLQALIGARVAEPSVHRFPLAIVQQTLLFTTGVGSVRSATETSGKLIEKGAEPFQQRTRRRIRHASEDKKSGRSVQEKLTK